MLQYLVVLLDDISIPFCHADNPLKSKRLINIGVLKEAIIFGMKNNLMIQYVLPEYNLPEEYFNVMEYIDNVKIGRDVKVYNSIPLRAEKDIIVLRINIEDFINSTMMVANLIQQTKRISIIFTNIHEFNRSSSEPYLNALNSLHDTILTETSEGKSPQINILTDRLNLSKMSNCGAGDTNITIAPNGKFYICPAFYYDERKGLDSNINYAKCIVDRSVGDLKSGINIKNKRLLTLDCSPLCNICDAYHCSRCVWLNSKLTNEVNTPSFQQCLVSNIERNSSMLLAAKMREQGFNAEIINEIDYIDTFDKFMEL